MNILLLMMGGSGTRFGASIPKQYTLIHDAPVFSYILAGYQKLPEVDRIVIVSHKDWIPYCEEWAKKVEAEKLYRIVPGGETRSESVLNGLRAVEDIAGAEDVVLIHDATHPYVDADGTRQIIEAVKEIGGATLGQCQYDTCYRMDDEQLITEVVPRKYIVSGASPEAFRYGDIFDIYRNSPKEELEQMTSAGAIALAHGIPMKVIPAQVLNLKITYPGDMELFKLLCDNYFFYGNREQ